MSATKKKTIKERAYSVFFLIKDKISIKKKEPKLSEPEKMIQLYLKYIPELKKILRNQDSDSMPTDGDMLGRMYDFYANYDSSHSFLIDDGTPMQISGVAITPSSPGIATIASSVEFASEMQNITEKQKEVKKKITAKPIEVMGELEKVPTPFDCVNLDEKIETLKDKSRLLNQRYAKAQIDGLTKRLENRKKYHENVEFFSSFPNTTDEKIDALLQKYDLVMKESDLFVPTFPKEAIDIMKKYSDVVEKIATEKPVFYVIAEPKDFKKKFEKLDPILLVQSPFGFYWQILGAWDKEMLLLTEL